MGGWGSGGDVASEELAWSAGTLRPDLYVTTAMVLFSCFKGLGTNSPVSLGPSQKLLSQIYIPCGCCTIW